MTGVFELDSWLAGVLGIPAYRLNAAGHDIDVARVVTDLHARVGGGRAFAYVKIPADNIDLGRQFSRQGFYVVDVPVTFHRPADPCASLNPTAGVVVRRADAKECEIAQSIASSCIVFSRFHVDPAFSKAVGDHVNGAWLDSYRRGVRGEEVLIAEYDGRIVGFNAILRSQADGIPCRIVDLIGVDHSSRRLGIGQAMMQQFIKDTSAQGLAMRVTTQAANIPAVNLYVRNGFRLAETALVLHRHFN